MGVDHNIFDVLDEVVIVEDGEESSIRDNLSVLFFDLEDDRDVFLVFKGGRDPGCLVPSKEFRLREEDGLYLILVSSVTDKCKTKNNA